MFPHVHVCLLVTKMNGIRAVFHVDTYAACLGVTWRGLYSYLPGNAILRGKFSPSFHAAGFFQPAPVFRQTIFSCGFNQPDRLSCRSATSVAAPSYAIEIPSTRSTCLVSLTSS